MSEFQIDPPLSACGCCETEAPPPAHYNPPGQPVLSYRLGTYASFWRRLQHRLASEKIAEGPLAGKRPLADLTTRDPDDPSLALLDAWAVVADVLTFYQERLANEGYLRTATERRSVLEMARAIGYELGPGVAAQAWLAFTVAEAPGAPASAQIPRGTKVQSVPEPGQLPQTFETSHAFEARAVWNALQPRQTRPPELALIGGKLYLLGLTTDFPAHTDVKLFTGEKASLIFTSKPAKFLKVNEKVKARLVQHLYLHGTDTSLKPGDLLLLVGKNLSGETETAIETVQRVAADHDRQRTRVDFAGAGANPPFAPREAPAAIVDLKTLTLTKENVESQIVTKALGEKDLAAFLKVQKWQIPELQEVVAGLSATQPAAGVGVFAFRERLGFFGHNAPLWETLPASQKFYEKVKKENDKPQVWEPGAYMKSWGGCNTIWNTSQGTPYSLADAYLERSVSKILPNSWVIIDGIEKVPSRQVFQVSNVVEESLADYGLSARVTGLKLTLVQDMEPQDFLLHHTTAHVQSEALALAPYPIDDPLPAKSMSLLLDGLFPGLTAGRGVALKGEWADAPGAQGQEILVLTDITHTGGYTQLIVEKAPIHSYQRHTVTINANVVAATHGESVTEVLGGGDGAKTNQRLALKKPPLTYVSAPTAGGGQSTLTVRVNDVAWEEVPSLYGREASCQCFITRRDDAGQTTVIFGDGVQGSRLPTGQENVVASYRSGLGLAGEVAAGSLTLLMTRPLGIREVVNPLPASGAGDPEDLDSARTNAPRTVLTFERIVSLQDYEDFARSFAGIGKARATVLWDGENRLVHITVASSSGKPVDYGSPLYANLVEAIDEARDPTQAVRVDTFQLQLFNVKAGLLVDSRYDPAKVSETASAALRATFSFARRAFGQPVSAAEVSSTLQALTGVVAVDLDELYLVEGHKKAEIPRVWTKYPIYFAVAARYKKLSSRRPKVSLSALLPAVLPGWPRGQKLQLAELLLINPVGITLTEMQP